MGGTLSDRVKPHVLIVDDNSANRAAFEAVLNGDYLITLAESGARALELTDAFDYAVILMDVRMPMMDGFEAAEKLRNKPRTAHVPIVFTSAFEHNTAQIKRAFLAGATEFVLSPVDGELLKMKVAAFAAIHLRNESLKIQISQLTNLLQSLHVELSRQRPMNEQLRKRISELEGAVKDLRAEMALIPTAGEE
jgi:two-component system, sensor histidine kinase